MRYIHRTGKETIIQSNSNSFHISHPAGGYLSLAQPNISRYQGLTRILPKGNTWELCKTIESIEIGVPADTLVLNADSVERVSAKAIERFSVTKGATTYDIHMPLGEVKITLDMRLIHDFNTEGRRYELLDVPSGQVIIYHCPNYSFSLAILGGKATLSPKWHETNYPYDAKRGTQSRLWVCECLTLPVEHSLSLRFGVGWTPAEALADANNTSAAPLTLVSKPDLSKTNLSQPDLFQTNLSQGLIPKTEFQHTRISQIQSHDTMDSAYMSAAIDTERALVPLPTVGDGILAGYPWFFQVYTRDEAISAGALISAGAPTRAKQVLLRQISQLHADGRISNRTPGSELASADGVGWAFLRLRQLVAIGACNAEEKKTIYQALVTSLRRQEQTYLSEGLIHNGWKETWMDTTGGSSDGRPGARIEIQGLMYSMYTFAAQLSSECEGTDGTYYTQRAAQIRDTVRALFYDASLGTLADGIHDHVDRTARPNVFIAAYAAPELFTISEWKRIFSWLLSRLWLNWGGLSTIDKEHMLFIPRSTGEDDRSYHRGDSWYFLNNIAAIVLCELEFTLQSAELHASARTQILTLGIPGHAAETSSAADQEALGCFVQTWSAATFVELHLVQLGAAARPGLARFLP